MKKLILILSVVWLVGGCNQTVWPFLTQSRQAPYDDNASAEKVGQNQNNGTLKTPAKHNLTPSAALQNQTHASYGDGYHHVVTAATNKIAQLPDLSRQVVALESTVQFLAQAYQQLEKTSTTFMGRYEARIVAIQARLEQGTEKNNPRLRQRWDQAHHFLAQAITDFTAMETYEALVTIQVKTLQQVVLAIQAASLQNKNSTGDIEILAGLKMRSNKALTQAEQILANLSRLPQQKAQQQAWQKLAVLSRAIQAGVPLPLQDENILPLWANPTDLSSDIIGDTPKPLVRIRFNRPDISYEQTLYDAIRTAYTHKTDLEFRLLAVNLIVDKPTQSSPTLVDNAINSLAPLRDVFETMLQMGVERTNMQLAFAESPQIPTAEIHVFVR